MTSRNRWVPSKLDDIEGASDLSIRQFPPIPIDTIDAFYNSQDDIRATKSDLEVDPAVLDNNERYRSKPTRIKSEEYKPKTKAKNKRNKQKWVNNNNIRWKDQSKVSSFPTHLLQKNDPPIEGVPSAVARTM